MIWIFWKRPGEGTSNDWHVFDWFKSTPIQLAKRIKLHYLVLARVCVPVLWELPRWHSGKESACQSRRHRRHGFQPWVGKIAWRRKWQSTPAFLPGKFRGQRSVAGYSPWDYKESYVTAHTCTCVTLLFKRKGKNYPVPGNSKYDSILQHSTIENPMQCCRVDSKLTRHCISPKVSRKPRLESWIWL